MVSYKLHIQIELSNGEKRMDSKDLTERLTQRGFDIDALECDPQINLSPGFIDGNKWELQNYQSGEFSCWNAGSVVSTQKDIITSIGVRQDEGLYAHRRKGFHWNIGPIILKDKKGNKIKVNFKNSVESIYDSDTIKVRITLVCNNNIKVLLDKEFNKRDFPLR